MAYDCGEDAEVLVVPVVLCHLGDSPMHAEISNTLNPSSTLTPCRTCKLTVVSRAEKQTEGYVQDFVGINAQGLPVCSLFSSFPCSHPASSNSFSCVFGRMLYLCEIGCAQSSRLKGFGQ